MTMHPSAPNVTCAICGYSWWASGKDVEDLLCFRCNGWIKDKDGKMRNPDTYAEFLGELRRRVKEKQ